MKWNTYPDEISWHLTQSMLDGIKEQSHLEGARAALLWLSEIYADIENTDVWANYMDEEEEE